MCSVGALCFHRRGAAESAPDSDFFDVMQARLALVGGLIPEALLCTRWRRMGRPPQALTDCLDSGRLRSIARVPHHRWIPAFQLQVDGCTPREDVAVVADELEGAMDAAEILAWFACSNAALDGRTPLSRLRANLPAVLEAARLDRFIGSA